MYSGDRTQKVGPQARKCEELSTRQTRGGGAACYNRDTSSLDRFQAQPIWEMSVKSFHTTGDS